MNRYRKERNPFYEGKAMVQIEGEEKGKKRLLITKNIAGYGRPERGLGN